MSTTFGIKSHGAMIPIALRRGAMVFLNDFSKDMADSVKVWPLDNGSQGIFTLGDIRKAIETGDICPK